jgi:hypothetical protein
MNQQDQELPNSTILRNPPPTHAGKGVGSTARTLNHGMFTVVFAGFLALLTFLVYRPVSDFTFLKFDDDKYVTGDLGVQRGITLDSVWKAFTDTGFTGVAW